MKPVIDWPIIPEHATIDERIHLAMMANAAQDEEYLRRHTPMFFAQGYRTEELVLHRKRMLGVYPDRDLLCLMPRRHVSPLMLRLRMIWRRWFPYKVPKSKGKP